MMILIRILANIFIIGLFLYSKLLPYKDRLNNSYKGIFNFFDSIFTPLFKMLNSIVKPFKVGQGLSVDMTQILILLLFLAMLNL